MHSVVFLIFRRMRAPLLALISIYAIAILGLVLIPGQDDQGIPWRMDFLHAFYFVSYMATTIGFGEIPYTLIPAQRMWVIVCIYATVVVWLYSIGKILGLLQDPALRRAMLEKRFSSVIKRVRDPFYLVCGYGDTGAMLIDALVEQDCAAVVIDHNPDRINALRLSALPMYIPGLLADASLPEMLSMAGLSKNNCIGVVAITDNEDVNLHIAMTAKLLHPGVKVICRAESKDIANNMYSFNTDYVIDPFEVFAGRMASALKTPCMYVLQSWLTGSRRLQERIDPPKGLWVLAGYGRFGQALHKRLSEHNIETIIIEATPENTATPPRDSVLVKGWGTQAHTLEHARIRDAVGIVAGTDHDTNNLSILMTAGMINPDLFMVARQNRRHNDALFEAIEADLVAKASSTLANRIRTLLTRPMLVDFFRETKQRGDDQARELVVRLAILLGEENPEIWQLELSETDAPAVIDALQANEQVTLSDLCRNNTDRDRPATVCPLLLLRLDETHFMPDTEFKVQQRDVILFAGRKGRALRQEATLVDPTTLMYVRTGDTRDPRAFWQRVFNRITH